MFADMYCITPDTNEPIMLLDRPIGYEQGSTEPFIDGNEFARELLQLDTLGKKKIQVWINSPGGNVAEGMAIYNAILKTKTNVDTYCVGIAASIAAVIFQAGRNRIMSDYGQLMYHNPSGADNSVLRSIKSSLVTMICSRSGKEDAEVSKMMDRETWIQAGDAIESGLCDKIEHSNEHNKPRKVNEVQMYWADSNKIINNIFKTNTNMKAIALSLGLAENATELEITNAINALKKPVKKAKADGDEPDGDEVENGKPLANVLNVVDELKAALKSSTDLINELKNKVDNSELATKTAAAEELVNKHIEKIGGKTATEDVVNQWKKDAIADFAGTATKLESLPVNKVAVKIENVAKELKAGDLPTTALGMMAKINMQNKKAGFQTII